MARVFISFVHEDQQVAEAVKKAIEYDLKIPRQVFMISDPMQVSAGADWLERIRTELSAAEIVVLMMSARSVKRPWVNFEAGAGWLAGKTLIPVCYGNMSKGKLPKPYSNFQALDLPSEEAFLIQSIGRYLNAAYFPPALRELVEPNDSADTKIFKRHVIKIFRPDIYEILAGFKDEPLAS
jgi:hypothetical protein